jgi:hypothetical protein
LSRLVATGTQWSISWSPRSATAASYGQGAGVPSVPFFIKAAARPRGMKEAIKAE